MVAWSPTAAQLSKLIRGRFDLHPNILFGLPNQSLMTITAIVTAGPLPVPMFWWQRRAAAVELDPGKATAGSMRAGSSVSGRLCCRWSDGGAGYQSESPFRGSVCSVLGRSIERCPALPEQRHDIV